MLGLYLRARRNLLAALVDRAVAEERSRLAGEMHDVVSHRLSLMLLQAGAMSVRSTDPSVLRSVEELRENGVAALAELQDVFGVLRTSPPGSPLAAGRSATAAGPGPDLPAPPGPGVAELVAQWRAAGTPLTVAGTGLTGPLDTAVRRTAIRVVQEGLTNAAKHAPGAAVDLRVDSGPDGVSITVQNGPPGGSGDPALAGSRGGWGLTGLTERAGMVGGTLSWEDTASGGFRLCCRLPASVPAGGAG